MTSPINTRVSANPWVSIPLPRPAARLRLFGFPYAGGGLAVFRQWAEALPAEMEFCPVQLPGRENRWREPAFDRLPPLVAAVADNLQPYLDRPFAFFGHSLGALIAFEVTRQLRRSGRPAPRQLFISARRAPHWPDPDPPLHALPEAAFVEGLQQRYNNLPPAILQDAELLALFLPTLRADFAVLETYVHAVEPPLACPITCYGGRQDPRVSAEALAAWGQVTTGAFATEFFPGGHFFLQTERAAVLAALSRALTGLLSL